MIWPLVNLPDICRPKQWPTIPKTKMLETGFPVYGANGQIGYFAEYNHEEPTILITCRGATCGTINVCEPKSYVTGNAMALDDLDASRVNLRFLTRALENADFSGVITGVAQPQITRQSLSRLQIPLPPLAEQKRIAGILDAADALRAKRREALAQLDTLLQSTFLDMFGDPVTNPMGWEVKDMGDTCDILTGFAFPSGKFIKPGTGIALCRGINIAIGRTNWRDRVDWPVPYPDRLTRFEIRDGDIVLAMDRPWIADGLKVAVVTSPDLPALLVQRVARIRAKDTAMQRLIYALIRSNFFEHHCNPTETTVPHISPRDLKAFPVIQPPLDLQRRFAAVVESVEQQKARMRKHLAELDALFASLQSRAFNGEL